LGDQRASLKISKDVYDRLNTLKDTKGLHSQDATIRYLISQLKTAQDLIEEDFDNLTLHYSKINPDSRLIELLRKVFQHAIKNHDYYINGIKELLEKDPSYYYIDEEEEYEQEIVYSRDIKRRQEMEKT